MTVNIELRPEEERALLERARKSGRDVTQYVHQVLAEHLRSGQGFEAHSRTFDEILTQVRDGWQQAGMSPEEITELFEETGDEVRKERRVRGDPVSQGGLPGGSDRANPPLWHPRTRVAFRDPLKVTATRRKSGRAYRHTCLTARTLRRKVNGSQNGSSVRAM